MLRTRLTAAKIETGYLVSGRLRRSGADRGQATADALARYRWIKRHLDLDMAKTVLREFRRPDELWWSQLDTITAPTLLIHGGPESHVAGYRLEEMDRLIPNCRLVTFPVGHRVHLSDPERFAELVLAFLASDPAPHAGTPISCEAVLRCHSELVTEVPNGLELAFLSNLEYFRELTRSSGGIVHDQDGVTCFASPHPLPFLVNGAFRTDQAAAPNSVLDLAQDFFATLGRGVALTALEGRDEDLISAAVAAGYGASDHSEPLQVLARQRLDGHEVAGIDFRTVTEEAAVADYTAVCAEAHAPYGFPDDLFPTLFARPGTMLAPHVHAFVGYDDADPVAAATLFLTHGVAYVGWVAVRPGHQRRGLGAAATATVVNRGYELGASCSTLLASPMGAPVYRRLGFVDVGWAVDLAKPPLEGP